MCTLSLALVSDLISTLTLVGQRLFASHCISTLSDFSWTSTSAPPSSASLFASPFALTCLPDNAALNPLAEDNAHEAAAEGAAKLMRALLNSAAASDELHTALAELDAAAAQQGAQSTPGDGVWHARMYEAERRARFGKRLAASSGGGGAVKRRHSPLDFVAAPEQLLAAPEQLLAALAQLDAAAATQQGSHSSPVNGARTVVMVEVASLTARILVELEARQAGGRVAGECAECIFGGLRGKVEGVEGASVLLDPPSLTRFRVDGVRAAAMHEVAGPVVRILVELEAQQAGAGWTAGQYADRILCGLVGEVEGVEAVEQEREAAKEPREEYLAGMLRHSALSPTFEMLLHLAPAPVSSALWTNFFAGKVHRRAANAIANFVVAVGIGRVNEDVMRALVGELSSVAEVHRGEWTDNYRTGCLRALMESAARLQLCEKEVFELMLDTFGLKSAEEKKLVVPCVLTLNRLQHWKKLASGATPVPTTGGAVLLQTWRRMHAPYQQAVLDSITSLPFDSLLPLTRSATSPRILDALLTSPTPPRALCAFVLSLLGHFLQLADDRIGSRIAERAFATADPFFKDKIAASLELPLWGRKREDWKAKMARLAAEEKEGARVAEAPAQAVQEVKVEAAAEWPKKRERRMDNIDDIFAGKAVLGAGAEVKAEAEEPEEDERPAKRARKEAKRAAKEERTRKNGGKAEAVPVVIDQEGMGEVLKAIKASL
ncbi:hypothetical protein JCM10207_002037 [Rhodosporidiobolus poonsookiae]